MHRVRLLRHYNITPYIVFDGGPLPAKQGTESGRKQKRGENLERANSLAAQGNHSLARDFYAKCVDVTPQMAYQLIKVMSAEKCLCGEPSLFSTGIKGRICILRCGSI